ncbi:MAG: cupin domain-containing protein [Elusimicrobiota bacterium]|nr:cupin domain-containing protein [Elusimicrobiota bacterium]
MDKTIKVVNLEKYKETKKVLNRQKNSKNFSCGFVMLRKNETVPEHSTENKEEIIIVLQGKAKLVVDGKKSKTLYANSLAYIPPNVKHFVTNRNSKLLKYLYITVPCYNS